MGLRFWLRRTGTGTFNMFVQLGILTIGPLPEIHYRVPGPGRTPRETRPPETAHGPRGNGGRPQGLPPGHPEQRCTTPPSRVEQELWAALGIDVRRTGG